MTNRTKRDLEDALKTMLLQKPLDKITIRDLTDVAGISRMAFYYHFQDIYDLVEWVCIEDARIALDGKKTADTWQDGLAHVFEAVRENKPFVLNAYHSLDRERMERFLLKLTTDLIRGVVDEKSRGINVSDDNKAFIARFYTYSFVGLMLDWIGRGMTDDYHDLVQKICLIMHAAVDHAIAHFADR